MVLSTGLEPATSGLSFRRLLPIGLRKHGTHDRGRTCNDLGLSQVPLPVGLREHVDRSSIMKSPAGKMNDRALQSRTGLDKAPNKFLLYSVT